MAKSDLLRMERMSYAQKIKHWGRRNAFENADGRTIRFPNPPGFNRSQVIMRDGHIVQAPPFFGRPCFGIPTAFLRHHQRPSGHDRNGRLIKTRCLSCNLHDTCGFVAWERLHISAEVQAAHRAFQRAGGTPAMWNKKGSGVWRAPWRELIAALISHGPLESVNDAFVATRCQELEDKLRADALERKRKQRRRVERERAAKGEFSPDFLSVMRREKIYRRIRYEKALETGELPREFSHIPKGGERFDAEVWEVLQIQRFSSAKVTAYAVAKRMLEEGRIGHRDVNSARQRVGAAIKRSKKLERTKLDDGKPVFPTLSVGEVLESIQVASTYEF